MGLHGDDRATDPPPAQQAPAAERLARRYTLLERIGQGGLGTVDRAVDESTGRTVALKRVRVREADDEAETRALFEREYRSLRQLAHPSIIEVYDYGLDDDGMPYYTMELLSGQDLRDLAPLPWREVCELLLPVASSLAVLHSRRLLHRDVTARNVRRTADGRAKLFDFGAMASMGVSRTAVGTPPYLAPEALHCQPLDARTDLYALGGLLYFMLTGRHAYWARTLAELRDRWRSTVPSPHQRDETIPQALSKLVMALLSLDANARPTTAAEVMAKLSAIAGLPLEEDPAVHRAYLTTPKLVAREAELLRVRKLLVRAGRGRGGSLYIEAEAGLGRSRMLDACLLEAKLGGALAGRVGAGDAAAEDYLAVRKLLSQLREAVPDSAPLPELADSEQRPPRAELQRRVLKWLAGLCRERVVVLLVDDYHRIDEASAALLAAVADGAGQRSLAVIASAQAGATHAAPVAWEVFCQRAERLPLEALPPAETEALLRSIFGDVAHARLLSARLHAAAGGSPQRLLEIAQQLVDRGTVKYEAGGWVLPDQLLEISAERAAADLSSRLEPLSARARDLAEVMALSPDLAFTHDECARLCGSDPDSLFQIIDELCGARVLVREGTHHRLAYADDAEALDSEGEARRTLAHDRLAQVLLARGALARAAVHFMLARRSREAVRCLLQMAEEFQRGARREVVSSAALQFRASALHRDTLAAAVEAARSERERFMLRLLIAELGIHCGPGLLKAQLPALLSRLTRDCGLADYRELSGDDRMARAVAAAQARFDACPEAERVLAPSDALRLLPRVVVSAAQVAIRCLDHEIIDMLPSLEPLLSLSPSIVVAQLLSTAIGHLVASRHDEALDAYRTLAARLDAPDRAGLDGAARAVAQLGATAGRGLTIATFGEPAALALAEQLDENPHGQVLACHVRVVYYLALGDAEQAEAWQRRAEMLEIQRVPTELTTRAHLYTQLTVSVFSEDLLGVKQTLGGVASMAEWAPGWRPVLEFARASYEHIRGDHERALAAYACALELALPGRHATWPVIKERQLWLLVEMGRLQEAIELGDEALLSCQRERQPRWLRKPIALAHARLGEHERARALALEELAWWEHAGRRGLHLGRAHETLARVALHAGDREAFERHALLCAQHLLWGDRPALHAKYKRLMDEARQHGFGLGRAADAVRSRDGAARLRLRALTEECSTAAQRARKCLDFVLELAEGGEAYLFGATACGLRVLSGSREAPDAMRAFVAEYIEAEVEESEALTLSLEQARQSELCTVGGRRYRPLLLRTARQGDELVVGVLMYSGTERADASRVMEAASAVAAVLLDAGDVDPFHAAT